MSLKHSSLWLKSGAMSLFNNGRVKYGNIGAMLVLSLVQVLVESDSHLFSKCSDF